jgi:hypothetical protein
MSHDPEALQAVGLMLIDDSGEEQDDGPKLFG